MSDTLRERCYRAALDAHPWRVAGETKAVVDTVLAVLQEAEEQTQAEKLTGLRLTPDQREFVKRAEATFAVTDEVPLSSPAVAGEQDGCAHEWVYDSEGDYGECKLCDASINVVAGFSRTIHQPLPVRPPTGEQESDQ